MVPVFFKGKIVSVVAVANRATGYTELDAKDLTAFCEAIQEIIERKKLEGALIIQNELYMQLVDSHPAGIYRVRIFPPTKWEKNAWDSSKSAPYVMELVSGRFCEILGIDKDVYSRNPSILNDLISSEDKASAQVMEGRHPERPQAFLVSRIGRSNFVRRFGRRWDRPIGDCQVGWWAEGGREITIYLQPDRLWVARWGEYGRRVKEQRTTD